MNKANGAENISRPPCDVVVRNAYVVTMDAKRRIFSPGAVAILGNSIMEVGPELSIINNWDAKREIDAKGGVVHPGFIDAHVHIVHGTGRGVFPSSTISASTTGALETAKQSVYFPDWKAGVTPEDEYAATQLAGLELLQNGFTGFVEPGTVFDTDSAAAAAEKVGVRALLAGSYLWDQLEIMEYMPGLMTPSLARRVPPDRDRCMEQLGCELHRNQDENSLARGYVSVYGLATASDELLCAAKSLADEHGVAFQQHEGYEQSATQADNKILGKSRISHLAEIGVLGENASLIHMNFFEDDDIKLLAESKSSIIWCPIMFLKMGLGDVRCRIPELKDAGINIALGIDGAVECTIGDAAFAAHLASNYSDGIVTPGDILEMQTIGAAKTAGIDDFTGSIEAGKRADLVIRTQDCAESWPGVNPILQLALMCRAGTVGTVITNGDIVYEDGHSTRVDETDVYEKARESVLRRLQRLDVTVPTEWPIVS